MKLQTYIRSKDNEGNGTRSALEYGDYVWSCGALAAMRVVTGRVVQRRGGAAGSEESMQAAPQAQRARWGRGIGLLAAPRYGGSDGTSAEPVAAFAIDLRHPGSQARFLGTGECPRAHGSCAKFIVSHSRACFCVAISNYMKYILQYIIYNQRKDKSEQPSHDAAPDDVGIPDEHKAGHDNRSQVADPVATSAVDRLEACIRGEDDACIRAEDDGEDDDGPEACIDSVDEDDDLAEVGVGTDNLAQVVMRARFTSMWSRKTMLFVLRLGMRVADIWVDPSTIKAMTDPSSTKAIMTSVWTGRVELRPMRRRTGLNLVKRVELLPLFMVGEAGGSSGVEPES
ncbi:hypothetical protein B0H19DRAFT_1083699 [Mycena capillaripes]|nr:hypothetical protein B0H19DRAFT_1083699 [Mycena capillaripes]